MAKVIIQLRVQARASRNEVVRQEADVWWIRLAAPPVEGKANEALIEFLSRVLGIPKSRLTITRGLASRQKAVAAEGLSETEANLLLKLATSDRR